MELTAYEQEEKANREAWKEMRKLTPYAQEVNAKREAWKEMGKLRKRIAELEKERIKLLSCLLDILDECIGEITMNYRVDSEYIGGRIQAATGMTHQQLWDAIKEQKSGS